MDASATTIDAGDAHEDGPVDGALDAGSLDGDSRPPQPPNACTLHAGDAPPPRTYDASGTVSLIDTAYPIPSAALFVSPSGNDANDGSMGSPLQTLGKAISVAPANSTIVDSFVRATTPRVRDSQPTPHPSAVSA